MHVELSGFFQFGDLELGIFFFFLGMGGGMGRRAAVGFLLCWEGLSGEGLVGCWVKQEVGGDL